MADLNQTDLKFYQKPSFIFATIGVLIVCIIILLFMLDHYATLAKDCKIGYKGSTEENKKIIQDLEKLKNQVKDMEAEAIILKRTIELANQQIDKNKKYEYTSRNLAQNLRAAVEAVNMITNYTKNAGLLTKTDEDYKLLDANMKNLFIKYDSDGQTPFSMSHVYDLLELMRLTKLQINELQQSLISCNTDKADLKVQNDRLIAENSELARTVTDLNSQISTLRNAVVS